MNLYKPNFADPRVAKRIKQALGFVKACISETKPHAWSTRYLDKHLGRNDNQLGRWLRRHLIITTNDNYSKQLGICKQYQSNASGISYTMQMLAGVEYKSYIKWSQQYVECVQVPSPTTTSTYPSVLQVGIEELADEWIQQEFGPELKTLDFKYTDKANRLWHPLQQVKRAYKKRILGVNQLSHQYDIECCALTLLHQYSQQVPEPMELYLSYVRDYLSNRKAIRQQIAADAHIPEELVKIILNALVAGAQLGMNKHSALYKLLNGDPVRIECLKQNPFIQGFRQDIKLMWQAIKPTIGKRTQQLRNGTTRTVAINSKQKWHLYFVLERQVLDQVRVYMDQLGVKYFLEHDGWSTQQPLLQVQLIEYIHAHTGFWVNLDYDSPTTASLYPSVLQVGDLPNGQVI